MSIDNFPPKKPLKIYRGQDLNSDIIIVDGQPGCGKTLLSPILAAYKRVEIMNFAFPLEWACRLNYFNELSLESTCALVKMHTDLQIYQNMMSRDVNFRFSDLSSVFKSRKRWQYIKRLFGSGDLTIPEKILSEKPILNLATHNLVPMSKPLFKSLGSRLKYIEVVRHPLFMLIQQTLNMQRLINDPRDIGIYFRYNGREIPYYGYGFKEKFHSLNPVEKAIMSMKYQSDLSKKFKIDEHEQIKDDFITVPFEVFVKKPKIYLSYFEQSMGIKFDKNVKKEMKRQKVPRANVVDGLSLAIYKRCGWTPPSEKASETDEYKMRRKFAVEQGASKKCLAILDEMSGQYESEYGVFEKNS